MKKYSRPLLSLVLISTFLPFFSLANVGGVAGSNIMTISGGTAAAPTYKIVSASTAGEAVYTGVVDAVTDSDTLSFATTTDESNATVYPFFAAGAFHKDAQVPTLTVSVTSGAVSGVSASYGNDGFQSSVTGFTNAPQIIISGSDGGGTQATASATLTSGEISSISITEGGSDYTAAEASVVGGPHLLRIIDTSSSYYGRVFLISNNTQTTLDLEFPVLASGETANTSTFFSAGTLVEVVRAPTLGNIFGIARPTNWTGAPNLSSTSVNGADWVYVWDSVGAYNKYIFYESSRQPDRWIPADNFRVSANNLVIYPDEAFIVAKRTSGSVELTVEGTVSSENQKLFLPAVGDQMLCNNPFGMDLLLTELIPSTAIGSGTGKFRPGTSDDGNVDYVTILDGSTWKKYWYTSSSTNSAVTSMMVAGARPGTGGSNALQSSDLKIGSGTVTDLDSCSDAAGSSVVTNYNDGNYTKISLSGTAPGTGFTITISDIQGYMLNDDGNYEVNATTGENVETNGTGSVVYSNLSGSHEVVGSGAGYVVIEKQRDVNFKSDEGSPAWSIGSAGAGYNTTARWWAVGGGGSGAEGTVNSSGTSFTVSSAGSGYTSAPQIVISGGGWRLSGGDSSPRGDETIGASDGIIISRRSSGGVASFIEPANPLGN